MDDILFKRMIIVILVLIVVATGAGIYELTDSEDKSNDETSNDDINGTDDLDLNDTNENQTDTDIKNKENSNTDDTNESDTSPPYESAFPVDEVDSNKEIHLINKHNKTVNISIEVFRNSTQSVIHSDSYEIEPDEETNYSLSHLDIDAVEEFKITARYMEQTEDVTIYTNACYGDAFIEVSENGLYAFYAIC